MKIYCNNKLVRRVIVGLTQIYGIKLYSKPEVEKNSGIVAFNFENVGSTEISYVLDKAYNIASRAGLHCAPVAHETLGTLKTGIVRLSVGCFNTIEEIEELIKSLIEISGNI